MSEAWRRKKRSWQNGDPKGSEYLPGREMHQKKSARDPGFTPTEKVRRGQLLNQFRRLDGPAGATEEFRRGYDAMIDPKTGRMRQ